MKTYTKISDIFLTSLHPEEVNWAPGVPLCLWGRRSRGPALTNNGSLAWTARGEAICRGKSSVSLSAFVECGSRLMILQATTGRPAVQGHPLFLSSNPATMWLKRCLNLRKWETSIFFSRLFCFLSCNGVCLYFQRSLCMRVWGGARWTGCMSITNIHTLNLKLTIKLMSVFDLWEETFWEHVLK